MFTPCGQDGKWFGDTEKQGKNKQTRGANAHFVGVMPPKTLVYPNLSLRRPRRSSSLDPQLQPCAR